MKKTISLLLLLAMVSGIFYTGGTTAKAAVMADPAQAEIVLLDNGDYLETTISSDMPVVSSGISTMATTKTITKTKTTYYKNSSGDTMWSIAIHATFTYNGSTSKCTSCSHSTTCPGKTWKIKSASSSKSGNTATAKATATQSTLFLSKDYTRSVTISCSKNGTVS